MFAGRMSELVTFHRARPNSIPDAKGFVPALCGQMMRFPDHRHPSKVDSTCKTCAALANLHPIAPQWWSATTQQVAFGLINDLQSTALAVRQAAIGVRPADEVIGRLDARLTDLLHRCGVILPEPSLHPSSCR
jgi:hypothetical protein